MRDDHDILDGLGIASAHPAKRNGKPRSSSAKATRRYEPAADAASGERVRVEVTADEHIVIAETLDALAGDPVLFHRGGELVHVVGEEADAEEDGIERKAGTPRIRLVSPGYLRERMAATCWFYRAGAKDEESQCAPPAFAVSSIATRGFWPPLRSLTGIVETPVLRRDGTILAAPGYDAATGLLFEPTGPVPQIPERPSRADALAGRDMLLEIIADFPFDKPHHRSAWFAALLTVLARRAFSGPAPLFLIDANVRGSGKSMLTDLIAIIFTGRNMPRFANPASDDEARKRITALAIAGDPLVLIDNIAATLGSASLDAALTSTVWKDRRLGASEIVEFPLRAVWFASGNNLILRADTSRRVCHCRLDSPMENPEERTGFAHPNLLRYVHQNRGPLLAAGLTVLRAFHLAGRPDAKLTPWGSFEGWSGLVRNAVAWVDLPDPGETRRELQEQSDQDAAALRTLFAGWADLAPPAEGLTAAEIMAQLNLPQCADLREALTVLANPPAGKPLDSLRIGYGLRRFKGRVIDGCRLEAPGSGKKSKRWRIVSIDSGGGDGGIGGMFSPFAREGSDFQSGKQWETSPSSPSSPPVGNCARCGFDLEDSTGAICDTCAAMMP
ncbi:MAG: hypothetical protein WD066_17705 [Planctomycetaceae bacterium]